MTLYQFNKLREAEQFDTLIEHGVIIAKRRDKKYKFVLYQVADIYVELKYHKDLKTLPEIKGFNITDNALLPYLERVDLSGLLKHTG